MVIRSKAITQSAKSESCAICGALDGTIVWAHSNSLVHGKGRGLKSHDIFGAFLCHHCHYKYDSGEMSNYDFEVAMSHSLLRLIGKGIVTIKGCKPEAAMSKILPRC
jgi:hypothetical protein